MDARELVDAINPCAGGHDWEIIREIEALENGHLVGTETLTCRRCGRESFRRACYERVDENG